MFASEISFLYSTRLFFKTWPHVYYDGSFKTTPVEVGRISNKQVLFPYFDQLKKNELHVLSSQLSDGPEVVELESEPASTALGLIIQFPPMSSCHSH